MMTQTQLLDLMRSLREQRVLSVYVRGGTDDPAARQVWRTELDRSLRDLRRWLAGSSHEEREAFERCVTALDQHLAPNAPATPGWVAFISNGITHHVEQLSVPVPTMAIWSSGMCVAPYIRTLKATRPVVVVVVDVRLARIYRYQNGELEPSATIHAHATIDSPAHSGNAVRSKFHPSVHGETAHDAVQRARASGTERMLREAETEVAKLTPVAGGIVVGGNSRLAAQFRRALGKAVSDRVLQLESLDVHASHAEITRKVGAAASALQDGEDLRAIIGIVDAGVNEGSATLGADATRRALARLAVRELYFTPRFLADHMPEAEELATLALDQGGAVEEVSGEAATRLDLHGGLAARLRYRLTHTSPESGALLPNASANGSIV